MKLVFLFVVATVAITVAQFFDPVVDDKTYLDRIDQQLSEEVEASAVDLIEQAKVTEKATKSYISIKLKDNVFEALRSLAKTQGVEFVNKAARRGRQDGGGGSGDSDTAETDQSEGGDEDTATEKATTPLTGLSTAVKINQNVFQFIGEAIKTIFGGVVGGKKNIGREGTLNDSSLTTKLPDLMQKPYGAQLFGILDLLKQENGEKKSTSGKVDPSPFTLLFGHRGRQSNSNEFEVADYIDKVRQTYPSRFPNLYRGISEPQRLLEAMSKVIAGIRKDIEK